MKKPLTSVGAFCYIDSIENNEEYIMKYLLLALSLLATPALAFEEPPPSRLAWLSRHGIFQDSST